MKKIRYLPPLSSESLRSPCQTDDGLLVIPCFPLEVADHARIVPYSKGVILIVSEARYMALMKSVQATSKGSQPGHGCLLATQIVRRLGEEHSAAGASCALRRGSLVKLKGLQRVPELNGSVGKLLHFKVGMGRWDVDVEGTGIRSLTPENLEHVSDDTSHKPFAAWLTPADVGGDWQLAEVGVMLHLDKLENITVSGKAKTEQKQQGYRCTFSAIGCARIHRICNPDAFAEKSTFLLARIESLTDKDEGSTFEVQENHTVQMLRDLLALHVKLSPELNMVPKKKVLDGLSGQPGAKFWEAIIFWELFLQARTRMMKLKNVVDNSLQKIAELRPERLKALQEKLTTVLTQVGGSQSSSTASIQLDDLPAELLGELRSLRTHQELTVFDRRLINEALPLQQLIQARTHRERLQIMRLALTNERARLEAEAQEAQGISLSEALEHGTYHGEEDWMASAQVNRRSKL